MTVEPSIPQVEDAAVDAVGTLRSLLASLDRAGAARWLPSAQPGRVRVSGQIPDPTAQVALDERRLALGAAVDAATSTIIRSAGDLAEAARGLDEALERFDGPATTRTFQNNTIHA